jgi:hypothetical protein
MEQNSDERSHWVKVQLELLFEIRAESSDDAKRLGREAAEFLLQCARWDELRELQEIRLAGHDVDPEAIQELDPDRFAP